MTSYHYEYATEAAYAKANEEHKPNPYVDGDSTPTQNAGSNASQQTLPATVISGLQADSTYHDRLVATNEAGTRYGQDETFTTTAEQSTSTTTTTTTTTTTQSGSQTQTARTTTTSTTSQHPGGDTGKPGHKSARLTSAHLLATIRRTGWILTGLQILCGQSYIVWIQAFDRCQPIYLRRHGVFQGCRRC